MSGADEMVYTMTIGKKTLIQKFKFNSYPEKIILIKMHAKTERMITNLVLPPDGSDVVCVQKFKRI